MSDGATTLLRARVARDGATATVHLSGELDLATGATLRTRLSTLLSAERPPSRVVVDLSALDFVDASGIGVLLGAHRQLSARGGRLVLRRPSALVRRVLSLLELTDVLRVES